MNDHVSGYICVKIYLIMPYVIITIEIYCQVNFGLYFMILNYQMILRNLVKNMYLNNRSLFIAVCDLREQFKVFLSF